MARKAVFCLMLVVFALITSGCETVKGAAEGAKRDWQTILEGDEWLKENLW